MPLEPEKEKKLKEILKNIGLGSREEAIAQAIKDLSDEEKLEFFSLLAMGEDDSLALMLTIAERYDLAWLRMYVIKKLKLRTSVQGWRAKQITDIAAEKRKTEEGGFFFRLLHRGDKKEKGLGEVADFE
jgi:hypothetical protein